MKMTVGSPHRPHTRAALVLALSLAAALGSGWLAPAGAAGPVVTSALLPLTGSVDGVSLTGVVHVVVQTVLTPTPPPIVPATVTVHVNLPAADVDALGDPDTHYIAYGAGSAIMPYDDISQPDPPPIKGVSGFVVMAVGTKAGPDGPPIKPFTIDLSLQFTATGELVVTSPSVDMPGSVATVGSGGF